MERLHHLRCGLVVGQALVLGPVVRLAEPIPYRGALGLWDVPSALAKKIARQVSG